MKTFLLIWRKEFQNSRQKRLGKCKVCVDLKEKLASEQTPQSAQNSNNSEKIIWLSAEKV